MMRTIAAALTVLMGAVPVSGAQEMSLLDQVKDFLQGEAWRFEPVDEAEAVRMRYEGQGTTWTVLVHAREDLRQVSFYSVLMEKTPPERRVAVAEYLHRANFGLALGCFELDYDVGRVRFRTSLDVEGAALSEAQIRNYLYMNVLTCELYVVGLLQVLQDEAAPAEAIAAVEQSEGVPDTAESSAETGETAPAPVDEDEEEGEDEEDGEGEVKEEDEGEDEGEDEEDVVEDGATP